MPKAVGGNIIVDMLHIKEKTKGSILLTSNTIEKEMQHLSIAKVLDVGPVASNDLLEAISVGDIIQFSRYGGTPLLSSKDKRRLAVRYEDICAIYSKEDIETLNYELTDNASDDQEFKDILKKIEV